MLTRPCKACCGGVLGARAVGGDEALRGPLEEGFASMNNEGNRLLEGNDLDRTSLRRVVYDV